MISYGYDQHSKMLPHKHTHIPSHICRGADIFVMEDHQDSYELVAPRQSIIGRCRPRCRIRRLEGEERSPKEEWRSCEVAL